MKLIYLLLVPLFCTLNITAKERNQSKSVTTQADSISDDQVEYRFALGVQLGTDIGGAIPFPFSNVPDVFNPYPKLSPSIGAKLTFPVTKKWTLGAEVTYKKVAIDADARIDNQRFHDDKNNIISRFCGSAEMSMDFTMLEIPLYFKYTFKNQKDRILAGLYGAWIINAKFRNTVTKGYMMTCSRRGSSAASSSCRRTCPQCRTVPPSPARSWPWWGRRSTQRYRRGGAGR